MWPLQHSGLRVVGLPWWLMAPRVRVPVKKVEAAWCFMAQPQVICHHFQVLYRLKQLQACQVPRRIDKDPTSQWEGCSHAFRGWLWYHGLLSTQHSLTHCILFSRLQPSLAIYNSLSSLSSLALLVPPSV